MKKVIILLADGVEEIEALTQVDYCRRAGITIDMVSVNNTLKIIGAHNIVFEAEKYLNEVDIDSYDGVIIPGGLVGVENILANEKALEIVKKSADKGQMVAAICAGPLVLDKLNLLENKKYSCYPGIEEKIKQGDYIKNKVLRDGDIITAPAPAFAQEFSISIVEYLLGTDAVLELQEDVVFIKWDR